MSNTTQEEAPRSGTSSISKDLPPHAAKTARQIRRVGYTVLVLAIVIIVVPLIIGAFRGWGANEIWDPRTKAPVDREIPGHYKTVNCHGLGLTLVSQGASADPAKIKSWTERCARYESVINERLQNSQKP